MKMTPRKLLVALLSGALLLAAALPAVAGGDRHDRREWRNDHRGHDRGYRGYERGRGHAEKYKHKNVIVHRSTPSRTVMQHHHYYPRSAYPQRYYAPKHNRYTPPRRYHSSQPSIVIGINLPPIVIPAR